MEIHRRLKVINSLECWRKLNFKSTLTCAFTVDDVKTQILRNNFFDELTSSFTFSFFFYLNGWCNGWLGVSSILLITVQTEQQKNVKCVKLVRSWNFYLNTKSGTPFFVVFEGDVVKPDSSLQQIIELDPFSPHLTSWLALISFDFNFSKAHLQALERLKNDFNCCTFLILHFKVTKIFLNLTLLFF